MEVAWLMGRVEAVLALRRDTGKSIQFNDALPLCQESCSVDGSSESVKPFQAAVSEAISSPS